MGASMTEFWLRAEVRVDEQRVALMPREVALLRAAGHGVTVEECPRRAVPVAAYRAEGATIMPAGAWENAPPDRVIIGLKELPDAPADLTHRHIFFAHCFKGQPAANALLRRFRQGGGRLFDLEALTDPAGRRLVAFGRFAGIAGMGVSALAFAAAAGGGRLGPVTPWADQAAMEAAGRAALGPRRPRVLVVGAKGRVGSGAVSVARALGLEVTEWDLAETASGGPFPEVVAHDILINAMFSGPGVPVLTPPEAMDGARALRVIGDVSCDPGTPYNPVPLYDSASSASAPVHRVRERPSLDVMAIDNLPALLPVEASTEFSSGLGPLLLDWETDRDGVWARAADRFVQALR